MKNPKVILLALIFILAIISCQKKQVVNDSKTKFEQLVEKAKAPTETQKQEIKNILN